ncbi:tyrosine-type recombinase/integrase [Paenibacillus sp. 32O-W]|uniref:tyrosine-type recombinase/integrase n=1 Tax=Paenibacillus sp. 32O-W TaxID=1695218 RepID=UPI001F236A2D|nr:tyrosine-type recombinase/integrase [Paenibacillus sp. 32O-W]
MYPFVCRAASLSNILLDKKNILLETGLRLNELLNSRVEDIRWADNEIYVYQGNGNKTRRVPFQKTCANAIREYLKERGDVSTDVLFVTVNHTPVHPRTFQDTQTVVLRVVGVCLRIGLEAPGYDDLASPAARKLY